MKVAVLGASGETGTSIVNGLLEASTSFEVIALTRPSSLEKPQNIAFKARGVKIIPTDLSASEDDLVEILSGVDVLISALDPLAFKSQIPLSNAAKSAGVKRFIPCCFATVGPPNGVMDLREMKENIIHHVKKIHLPYTIIDVGWWFQLSIPAIPSGRTDYATIMPANSVIGDGSTLSALTDVRDVGRWVARIISDERTLNKMVFAYNEVLSQNHIHELLEKLSNEKVERQYMPKEAILAGIEEAKLSEDPRAVQKVWTMQYLHSLWIRGDNTPEYAEYLGYVNARELYPDIEVKSLETFFQEVLEGNAVRVYAQKFAKP